MAANVALHVAPPPADSIVETERALIDGLVFDPSQVATISALVSQRDFFDPISQTVFRAFVENPRIDGLAGLRAHLEATGELQSIGGLPGFSRLGEYAPGASLLPGMAEDVALASLDRELRAVARRLADDPSDNESADRFIELREQAQGRRARRAHHDVSLEEISFSAESLLALLAEEPPEPVYPGIPPQGHFSLLIAPSFSGKTSLALWIAMARVRGQAPWIGAPPREPGRILFYSIDEAPAQVAHRIRTLAVKHPAGRFIDDYAHRFTITGPHRSVNPDKLAKIRFTEDGLRTLQRFLKEAEAQGDPFTDVIVDAYSDVLPLGVSDSDNEEATRIGGALESLAVTHGCAIQVIHHAGKPVQGGDVPDPRDLGRGASALAAKARAIFTCEEEVGMPNVRKIRTRTNLTASPPPLLVEVADRQDRGLDDTRVDFFRPHDPAIAYPINAYLEEDEGWISITQLARRIGGDAVDPEKKPPGNLLRRARDLRGIWDSAGLCEVRTGARNALELRRI